LQPVILTLVLTGRRRSDVINLKARDIIEVVTPDDRIGWISKLARFDSEGRMPR
jgi:hypothetical protein